ncbi:alkaline phosphatase family protein [Sunxiuqinia elliptica]|uniref:Type I phosphodiesterase/nucleotide pyrophosphatase n=1 Tax=Sunxiuqinia elliptica TaxID=655355 RepID=A0A4R6GUH0_9BACT|nr:alkaline phosphatase family protein [Sunxiuqinia elliptica]TDN99092.1 type I phosphodiesterase/nucleotide pyrophosphatase [Sunxiuqinia elliptica]TDO56532.1 type I phosphodiesterase/nucleotide pyrophosphatase [Sunxiuqinia elliptica]
MLNKFQRLLSLLLCVVAMPVVAQQVPLSAESQTRLVVVLNVEQMRTDYISRFWNQLQEGGFKRLVNDGMVCENASMDLHIQKTVTGVPTLFTGVYPSRHGIVNDSWYDRLRQNDVDALRDDYFMTVGSDSKEGQLSAVKLLSPTIGDVLKLSSQNQSKVFSVALNANSAVFSAGHSADGAYWMDEQTGNMISSSYFVDQFPDWVRTFNDKGFAEMYVNRDWETLLPSTSYTESLADDYVLEPGYYEKWNTLPYNLSKLKSRAGSYKILKTTPFGNTMVKDFALALIEAEELGQDHTPDLLAVNFSSMDYEQGAFNPHSVEIQDLYLRLDRNIEHLLNYLDKQVGRDQYMVVLSSACSTGYPVNYLKEEFNMPVGFVAPERMVALLKSYLNISYGQGEWVEFIGDQQIYLNRDLIEKEGLELGRVQEKAAAFINQFEGVKLALPAISFEQGDYMKSQLAVIANSFNFKRSGDILYALEDGWQPEYKYKRTIYNDNSRVPLIWYGKGIGKGSSLKQVEAVDMVPTILYSLGMGIPKHCTGRIIEDVLQGN